MSIALLVIVFLVAIGLHELGHSLAMRTFGIRTTEAGLGLPIPPMLTVYRNDNFKFKVSPWLLGAYVSGATHVHGKGDEPCYDDSPVSRLSFKQQAWVNNAGVFANFLVAAIGLTVLSLVAGSFLLAAGVATAVVLLWFFRRPFAVYVLPALSLPFLAFMGYAFWMSWSAGDTGLGFAGMGQFAPSTFRDTLLLFTVINVTIGILNSLPIPPLDNGKQCLMLVERWWGEKAAKVYLAAGGLLVALSLASAVASDLWALMF